MDIEDHLNSVDTAEGAGADNAEQVKQCRPIQPVEVVKMVSRFKFLVVYTRSRGNNLLAFNVAEDESEYVQLLSTFIREKLRATGEVAIQRVHRLNRLKRDAVYGISTSTSGHFRD